MSSEELLAEIGRLRGQVAQLEARVEQLDELAHQDVLVALPNRRAFERDLDRMIARVERHHVNAAVLYVDVDELKSINDKNGHRAGDEALIQIARILSAGLRRSDMVARIGGDEFGILLESADEQEAQDTAVRLCDEICRSSFDHDGTQIALSAAIGLAVVRGDDSVSGIIDRADAEMYRRKAA